jgi:superfamily I DNA/RNA helicase
MAPWRVSVEPGALGDSLARLVAGELAEVDGGTVAVLSPASRLAAVRAAAGEDQRVSVLTVEQAKGLEFDAVVLVSPDEIIDGSARGWNDLYVALTRATQRLGIVDTGRALPALAGARAY